MGINSVTGADGTQRTPAVDDKPVTAALETETAKTKTSATTSEDSLVEVKLDETNSTASAEKKQNSNLQPYQQQLDMLRQQLKNLDDQRQALINQLGGDSDFSAFMSSYNNINSQKQAIYNSISMLLTTIESGGLSTANSQALVSQLNGIRSQTGSVGININSNTALGDAIVALGNSFVGVINNDAQGNAEFSPGGISQAWCADFVTAIVKRACQATGTPVPAGFGSSGVAVIRQWGINNGRYIKTSGQANKAQIIASTVKPGDIMVQEDNGASHVGIVVKVYPDGSFDTVEGNTSDAVKNRHYDANSAKLSGFVRVT